MMMGLRRVNLMRNQDVESLEDMIASFLKEEKPDEDYRCDNCRAKGTCKKKLEL